MLCKALGGNDAAMNNPSDAPAHFDDAASHNTKMIRIFIVANQDIFVDGLIRVISDQKDRKVVACIAHDNDCFQHFCENPADILMIDQSILETHMGETRDSEVFKDFNEAFPELRIIVFGHDIEESQVRKMLSAGVHGFVDSSMTRDQLVTAIHEVYNGGYWVGRKSLGDLVYSIVEMDSIVEQGIRVKIAEIRDSLTNRESEVLIKVLEGLSTRQIADKLCLSEQSVKLHLGRLFRKFEVTNRSQLILLAFQRVCPANNLIQLFRKSLDKRRIAKGQPPLIRDPLAEMS